MAIGVRSERSSLLEAAVPALVDSKTFEKAGAQLLRNRRLATHNAKRQYLLRGLIRCGLCGAEFSGSVRYKNGKGFYYRCNGALYNINPNPSDRCKAGNIGGD